MKTLQVFAFLAIICAMGWSCEKMENTSIDERLKVLPDTVRIHDTIFVHDTILIHDTVYYPNYKDTVWISPGSVSGNIVLNVSSPKGAGLGEWDGCTLDRVAFSNHGHRLPGPADLYSTPSYEEHHYTLQVPSTPHISITVFERWENWREVAGHSKDEPLKFWMALSYAVDTANAYFCNAK